MREFIFFKDVKCDVCGSKGSYDIYGDLLCEVCLNKAWDAEHIDNEDEKDLDNISYYQSLDEDDGEID